MARLLAPQAPRTPPPRRRTTEWGDSSVSDRVLALLRTVSLGCYPIVTLEKQVLNMIGNLA
jgi:hypothetical protein